MKKFIVLFSCITLAAQAAEEFRDFTAIDGRKLRARVLSYDAYTDKVKIERDDGYRIIVKRATFQAEDQDYIREWIPCSLFLEPSKLIAIPRCTTVETWRRKHASSRMAGSQQGGGQQGGGEQGGGEQGGGEQGGGPGGGGPGGGDEGGSMGGGVSVIATDKNTKYHYELTLTNRSGIPLEGMTAEYRIFYTQDRPIQEEIPFSGQNNMQQGQRSGMPQGTYVAQPEDQVKRGTLNIGRLDVGDHLNICTEDITILERNAAGEEQGAMIDLNGALGGIWIKVFMKAPDGTRVERDLAIPKRIMKEHRWES